MDIADKNTIKNEVELILDFMHLLIMHHAIWFAQAQKIFGHEKALDFLGDVLKKSRDLQLNRIAKTLGFETEDGLPSGLLRLPDEKLKALRDAVAVNWLANDGIWFQAIEFKQGITDAKKCNDASWGEFSPLEAWSVKQYLRLPDNPGLEGLKKALGFRLYAFINKQSIHDDGPYAFIFRMDDCRVQSARKRKGLDDYPCKSGGLVEYTSFATAIDPRIKTQCICCPPDKHPEEYYCAWRFSIGGDIVCKMNWWAEK